MGNSLKGLRFCEELVARFNFHTFDGVDTRNGKIDPTKQKYTVHGTKLVQLLFAAANGDLGTLKRSHMSSVDMNMSDYDGRTALHLATCEGHLHCTKFLLQTCKVFFLFLASVFLV